MKKYLNKMYLLLILAMCISFSGCGRKNVEVADLEAVTEVSILQEDEKLQADDSSKESSDKGQNSPETTISEDGIYDSKDEVAEYIHIYEHLPSNYISKKEAKKLGWTGGSLEEYAPGKCIGGDYFGNYEGLLPEEKGRVYHECDIDTLGKSKRGPKRIIYSSDGLIYYTEDHYESFEQLY